MELNIILNFLNILMLISNLSLNNHNNLNNEIEKRKYLNLLKHELYYFDTDKKSFENEIIENENDNLKTQPQTIKDVILKVISNIDFLDTKTSFSILDKKGKLILGINPNKKLNQASVSKLIISLASIKYLGLNYRFKTDFYIDGKIDKKGILNGNLIIKAYGDPNLSTNDLYKIIDYLKLKGIKRIKKNIIYDLSYFDNKKSIYSLKYEDVSRAYAADNSALPLDYNSFYFSVNNLGKKPQITLSDSAKNYVKVKNKLYNSRRSSRYRIKVSYDKGINLLTVKGRVKEIKKYKNRIFYRKIYNVDNYFPLVFSSILKKNKIKHKRFKLVYKNIIDKNNENLKLLYRHKTKFLFDTLITMNRYSNNFIAEQLLKIIGAENTKNKENGSWENGIKLVKKLLKEIGIKGDYSYQNASGLNDSNFFSSYQIAKILNYSKNNFDYKWYILSTLPKMGISGTMKRYCLSEDCKGKIIAKTGTLRTTVSLAGFLNLKNEIFTFSIVTNFERSRIKRNKILKNTKKLMTLITKIGE